MTFGPNNLFWCVNCLSFILFVDLVLTHGYSLIKWRKTPISRTCTFPPAHWRLILLIHDFSLVIGGKLYSEYLGFSLLVANYSRNIPFFLHWRPGCRHTSMENLNLDQRDTVFKTCTLTLGPYISIMRIAVRKSKLSSYSCVLGWKIWCVQPIPVHYCCRIPAH